MKVTNVPILFGVLGTTPKKSAKRAKRGEELENGERNENIQIKINENYLRKEQET